MLASLGQCYKLGKCRNSCGVYQCVSTVRTVDVPVFFHLCSSCHHVTRKKAVTYIRLVLKVVMQNNRDFMDVMLL